MILEMLIVIVAVIIGYLLRDFTIPKFHKLNPHTQGNKAKVSVLYPQNTKEEIQRQETKDLEKVLKRAGISKIE